jgi:hypothetical protein
MIELAEAANRRYIESTRVARFFNILLKNAAEANPAHLRKSSKYKR